MVQDLAPIHPTEGHTFHFMRMILCLHVYEYVCIAYIPVLIVWQEGYLIRIIFYYRCACCCMYAYENSQNLLILSDHNLTAELVVECRYAAPSMSGSTFK